LISFNLRSKSGLSCDFSKQFSFCGHLWPDKGQFVADCGLNVLQMTHKVGCPGQVCGGIETNFIRVIRVIRGQNSSPSAHAGRDARVPTKPEQPTSTDEQLTIND
jgi:hypothetical protein